jgi:hypothetical protein
VEQKALEKIKNLIVNNIQDAKSFNELEMRLFTIQQTLENMKRPKERALYPVKTLTRKRLSKSESKESNDDGVK